MIMDAVRLHLIINHVPVIVTVLSAAVLGWAIISGKIEYRRLAFIGFILAAVFVLISFESGENAEDIVEELSGFSHEVIEDHEHAADTARWLTLILGAFGIIGLIFYNRKPFKGYKMFMYLCLLFSLVVVGYLAYTGYLGGFIRHTELSLLFQNFPSDLPV